VWLFLLAQFPLQSQVGYPPGTYPPGSYPPGGYPPDQYPGQVGGIPIPRPHRGKKSDKDSKTEPLQRAAGTLVKLDDKSVGIVADDSRKLNYKRTEGTRFFRDSKEIQASELKVGDRVSVEATEDEQGYLTAQNVYFEKDKPAGSTAGAPPAAQRGGRAPGNERAPSANDGDPGPPELRRGAPPPEASASEVAANTDSPDSVSLTSDAATYTPPPEDPLIEKAREALEKFTDSLPNYVCTEFMARYESTTHPVDWRPLDVVSAEVVYLNGHEQYRNVAVNGKAQQKGIEGVGGSWSTGEFITSLRALFATASEFRPRGESSIAGKTARVFDYRVDQARSSWRVQLPSQTLNPSYKGSLWIDPQNGRVLRLEMQARAVPKEFPMDTIESAVDYDSVLIGGGRFLLPTHAETLACQRGTENCSRNKIDFRNYHKYEAESSITFADK
jgi:hypothetical protein